MKPIVSILVPHFQTLTLTRLCLRLLRSKTRSPDYETILIDNGSTDGSGEELRAMRWLRVVRREGVPGERPATAHGMALNLGVDQARADFVLTIHTDTMVMRDDWLDFLLRRLHEGGPRCAAVGSWKLEPPAGFWRQTGKWFEHLWRRARGRERVGSRYIRSHCALYRRSALALRPEMFAPSDGLAAGEELHQAALAAGWLPRFLAEPELSRYVCHLNHATMALNEEMGANDPYMPRTRVRAIKRIRAFFQNIHADRILADVSLDT